jgi:hypothetical protein
MFMGESNLKKKNTPTKVTEAANQISQTMHAEDGTSITTKRVLGTRRKKTCAQETGERKTPQKKSRQRTGYIDGGCSSGLRRFRSKAHLYTRPWLFSVKVSVAI